MTKSSFIKISVVSDLYLDEWGDKDLFFPNTDKSKILIIGGNISKDPNLVMDFYRRHEEYYADVIGTNGYLEYNNEKLLNRFNSDIEASFLAYMKVICAPCWPKSTRRKMYESIGVDTSVNSSLWNYFDYMRSTEKQQEIITKINPQLLVSAYPNFHRSISNGTISPDIWVHGNGSRKTNKIDDTLVMSNSRGLPGTMYKYKEEYYPLVEKFDNIKNKEKFFKYLKGGERGNSSIITQKFQEAGLEVNY